MAGSAVLTTAKPRKPTRQAMLSPERDHHFLFFSDIGIRKNF
jgi:hypothetical protein